MMESSEENKTKNNSESQIIVSFKSQNLVREDIYYSTILVLQFPNSVTWETYLISEFLFSHY